MAVFSTNQNRHLYVVTDYVNTPADLRALASAATYPDPANAGKTSLVVIGAHDNPAYGAPAAVTTPQNADAFEFLYVNAIGEIMHSDIIWKHSIRSIRKTAAADMRKNYQTYTITRNPSIGSQAGENKIWYLTFRFPAFQNATDEEVMSKVVSFPWNEGNWADAAAKEINAVFAPKHNMYNELVVATALSANVVQVYAPEGGPYIKGQHTNKPTRMEVGAFEVEIFDDATLNTIPGSNNYRVKKAGTIAETTLTAPGGYITNAKAMEDLEWFCMGERGDQFRYAAFPNQIDTPYMLPLAGASEYDTLDIHYYFQGEGTRSDKSEKHITLVAAAGSDYLDDIYDVLCGGTAPENEYPVEEDDNNGNGNTPGSDVNENENQGGGGNDNQGGGGTEGGK